MSRQKSPHGWLIARWPSHYAVDNAKELDISRRITVVRSGEQADYWIEGITHVPRGPGYVRMEYLLSPVPGVTVPFSPIVTVAPVPGEIDQLALSWSEPFDGGLHDQRL